MNDNKYEYAGKVIEIVTDTEPANPRTEWDNLGKLVCWHSRYTLGDTDRYPFSTQFDEAEVTKTLKAMDVAVCLSVYMYEHSGVMLNTTGFSCPWDSGQVGIIYVTKEAVRAEYGKSRISKKLLASITSYLVNEVEIYSAYLGGEVYGYIITDEDGTYVESCYGFYSLEDVKTQAEESAAAA